MSPSRYQYKPPCGYTILAMVRADLASLPAEVRDALEARRSGAYDTRSPDNWKPFGNTRICRLVEDVAREQRVAPASLSSYLSGAPNAAALFCVFAQTDLYIVDCASLVIPCLAGLAAKIELAAHRRKAFFVPFDFGDALTERMRRIWKDNMPLLEFARNPSPDLCRFKNFAIYHEVPSEEALRDNLARVMNDVRTKKWGAGLPQAEPDEAELSRLGKEGPLTAPTLAAELT